MDRAHEALPTALKLSGQLLIAGGVLHCAAWIVSGRSGDAAGLILFGILYLLLGAGLYFRIPKIRYPALLITLIGVLGAYITIGSTQVASWLTWLFIAIDLVVIALLMASIWRGRQGG